MPLRLFLDWLLCVKWSIGGCRRPRCIIMSFFCHFYLRPNQCDKGPHTLHPCRASSPTSISLRLLITIWLLCFIIERQPPRAKAPSFYLFFDGVSFGAPNKGTILRDSKPDNPHLLWTDKKRGPQELGPWWLLPWREREKPMEGRAAVDCFWCLWCVFFLFAYVI
jgi:hypothetical protein